ncbi:TPA: DUF5617 domain-containing protein [Legionella pneumophila]
MPKFTKTQDMYVFNVKTVCLKNHDVGVNKLIRRFVDDDYMDGYQFYGLGVDIDFGRRTLEVNGKEVKLNVYDTPHPRRQQESADLKVEDILLVAFDLTNQKTLDYAIERTKTYKEKNPDKTIFMVGTKNDLIDKHIITKEQVAALSNELGCPIYLTSAKTREGVEEVFVRAAQHRLETLEALARPAKILAQKKLEQWHNSRKYKNERAHFETLWNDPKYPTHEEKILALLRDYTKNNSATARFFSGNWNRKNLEMVHAVSLLAKNKTTQELLNELHNIPLTNSQGTLATIIELVDERLSSNDRKSVFRP